MSSAGRVEPHTTLPKPARLVDASLGNFLLAVCLPMFVALAVAKGVAYGSWEWWSLRFPFKWALVAFQDFLFVLSWALAGAMLIGWTRRRPALRHVLRWAFVLASALCVVYATANVWIYSSLRMPLTYPLLMMAGGVANVKSSVASHVSFAALAALVWSPLAYLALVFALLQTRWAGQRRTYIILAAAAAVYSPVGVYGYQRWYSGGPEDALARSPHWAMLRSCIDHWRGNSSAALRDTGPSSYRDDFLIVGQRPAQDNPQRAASAIKNVIVVVLESTGTQFLSVYGSAYPTTPNLVAEAKNSVIYRNFYSNDGYTLYSVMPLVISNYPGNGWTVYASDYPHIAGATAAQVLHDRGYRTAFMTSQSLDYRGVRHFFENRGFDLVNGAEEFQKLGVGTMVSSWGMDDPPMFDQMLHWIDSDPAKPFYLMAWTQQTHDPYPPGPNQQMIPLGGDATTDMGRSLNRYLNNLRLADEQLGRLFAALRQRHLDQNTLVVITGDHGEAFGFPHPWFFHGTNLYQEGVNVPCILWSPALFTPGSRSEIVGAHVDLNPTIMDILGIATPSAWQGRSLLDPDRPQRAYFNCNTGYLLEGMREGDWKFIYNMTLAREELYDLASDPTEQHNLASQNPRLCAIYRQRLASWATYERGHLDALAK